MVKPLMKIGCLLVLLSVLLGPCDSFVSGPPFSAQRQRTGTTAVGATQLLEFNEPQTNVTVKLVGVMHYNPTSVKLATDTINELGCRGKLASVVIESCDMRWKTASEMNPTLQEILKSEMRAACDQALEYNRPVVLGDQRINETTTKMGDAVKQTFVDLSLPPSGWKNFARDVSAAWELALPSGEGYLDVKGFWDPKLLLAAPVSLLKYPLSYLVKSPLVFISVVSFFYFTDPGSVPLEETTIVDWLGSLAFALLETAVFARVLVKELLAERNEILATSILQQCRLYQPTRKGWSLPSWISPSPAASGSTEDIIYVPGSNNVGRGDEKDGDKTVVAILGMAHCNGIMKLLKEQRVS